MTSDKENNQDVSLDVRLANDLAGALKWWLDRQSMISLPAGEVHNAYTKHRKLLDVWDYVSLYKT